VRTSRRSILLTAGAALLLGSLAAPVRADILYVSSFGYNAVQRFTSDGAFTYPFFISGVNKPWGLAFDSTGILYVADDHTIEKYSQTGAYLGVFASTGAAGLAFDRAGNLYAATGSTIQKFTPDGVGSVFASSSGAFALAFDSAENLYVSNPGSKTIEKFTPDGVRSVFASFGLPVTPVGLAVDGADNLYASDSSSVGRQIYRFTPDGVRSVFADAGGEGNDGLAFGSEGDLYYTGARGFISKISPDGVESFFASPVSNPTFLALTDDNGVPLPLANQRPAPEPATLVLLTLGLPALLGFSRRRGGR
jgi:sugar lactone lactonase YvrE